MDIQALLKPVVQVSLMLIILAIGLRGGWKDVFYAIWRPGLVLRGIAAVHIVVPLVAIALCLIFPIAPATKAGIIVMAVSPLAPFAPGKMLRTGADRAYVIGLYVSLILVSLLLVPATIALLAIALERDYSLPVLTVGIFLGTTILLPLIVGFAAASIWPRFAARSAPIASMIGYAMLAPVAVAVLIKAGPKALSLLGDGSLFVITATIVAGFLAGHLLGGPRPEARDALAQAAATRHPGIAGLIAGMNFSDPDVLLTILLFLAVGMLLSALYAGFRSKGVAQGLLPDRSAGPQGRQ